MKKKIIYDFVGNCTIFAAKIKAWKRWVETTQPICAFFFFFVAKTVFSLDAAYNQFYFGCAVCTSCLIFAYCAITYFASGMSSEPTVLNYMPLVVSSGLGKSA